MCQSKSTQNGYWKNTAEKANQKLADVYAELGYTYYGLARSSNHPENPLGYGSGKLYASMGLSFKLGKH